MGAMEYRRVNKGAEEREARDDVPSQRKMVDYALYFGDSWLKTTGFFRCFWLKNLVFITAEEFHNSKFYV
jgi:hypothetical protein